MSYRVLAIDGGGTWALIPVLALSRIYGEETPGRTILSQFDLVVANSGGSIVAGALLEDLSPKEILSIFDDQKKRESIFSRTGKLRYRALHWATGLGPQYGAAKKLPALEKALPRRGKQPLTSVAKEIQRPEAKAELQVVIVGFDYDRNRATFFRSSPSTNDDFGVGAAANVTLAQAIHASTNAPVNYFDAPAVVGDRRYWDGAVSGNNNPVLSGVAEAVVRGASLTDIAALSLGTATVARPTRRPGEEQSILLRPILEEGLKTDALKLATAILDDPPDVATFLVYVMTGGKMPSRVVRMNPMISPVKDGEKWKHPVGIELYDFEQLVNLNLDAIQQDDVDLIRKLASAWLADGATNQPIRMDSDTLQTELGPDLFSAAKKAWEALLE
jgi:hypothetical protein